MQNPSPRGDEEGEGEGEDEDEDEDEGSGERFRELRSGEKLGGSATRFQGINGGDDKGERNRASRRSGAAAGLLSHLELRPIS